MALLRRLNRFLSKLRNAFFLSPKEASLKAYLKSRLEDIPLLKQYSLHFRDLENDSDILKDLKKSDQRIIFQVYEDHAYYLRFFYFIFSLKALGIKFETFWVTIRINFKRYDGTWSYIKRIVQENVFSDLRWFRLYDIFGGKVILRLDQLNWNKTYSVEAREIFRVIKTPKDVEQLSLRGLLVGDLIYDTYLRFKPAETVDIKDEFLFELIARSLSIIDRVSATFEKVKPTLLVSSYGSYLHHGLLVRVALQKGIKVWTLGAFNQLVTAPDPAFPFHRRNFDNYPIWFGELSNDNKIKARNTAREIMQRRLSGTIDNSTFYMKRSAYHFTNTHQPIFLKDKRSILIMGHDFFDSPHIYGEMIFPDFYIWLINIFEESKKSSAQIYYKPHPNAVEGNSEIVESLQSRFPHVIFLDPTISNRNILAEGFDLCLTVYGTVAHEFAYAGAKVACCGINPHHKYAFCETVLTWQRLKELIHSPEKANCKPTEDEVLEFVYVHNRRFLDHKLYLFPRSLDLSRSNIAEICSKLQEDEKDQLETMIHEISTVNQI